MMLVQFLIAAALFVNGMPASSATCRFGSTTYEAGDTWYPRLWDNGRVGRQCAVCKCRQGGGLDCTPMNCSSACRGSSREEMECCNICSEADVGGPAFRTQARDVRTCLLNGHRYRQGEKFTSNDTGLVPIKPFQCVQCICESNRTVRCTLEECPRAHCDNPVKKPGHCCPVCPGGVFADVCQQDSGLRPLLVTAAEPTPTVFAWPEEQVQLHCRPSQPGGCRWMKGSTELGTDCQLNTTERGTIRCLREDETCGVITLDSPRRLSVQHNIPWTSWRYRGEAHWEFKSSTFLCPSCGTIIRKDQLCDGTRHCDNGEDEWNCKPPCGPPFVGEHSALSSDVLEVYPDGSEVTYVCHPGFSFRDTLSGLNRTCRAGRWTPSPPICLRNVALNSTVSVTGQPMSDCGTAVDGILSTWCTLAPSGGPQALSVRLADNVTVTRVLVRALNDRYTVSLRGADQSLGELSCRRCHKPNSALIHPAASGVRVCLCPEDQAEDRSELLVRAESGAFTSLSVAEVVALEASDADVDNCAILGHPAHGRFEPAESGMVKLSCDPGYSPSCSNPARCFSVWNGDVRLSCLAAECPQPPAIPDTEITHESGTGRRSVTVYRCRTGYILYPADQNTTSSCDADGLWSIGHISCLPETDIRVVAMRLGQQHARSMAALRTELLAGQQRLLAEQNRTQRRLSKLERDVALLGLADRARLQAAEAAAAEEQLKLEDELGQLKAELARQKAASPLERQLGTDTELEELEGGAAELVQLTELERQLSEPDTADDVEVEVIQ